MSWALCASGCNGENAVAARVACYPPCLANLVQHCPLLGACNVESEADPLISNANLNQGVAACFAAGEKLWEATGPVTGDDYIVVKRSDGGECYTATSAGSSLSYTISFGGQAVAQLDATSTTSPPTLTCGGASMELVLTPDCLWAPWIHTKSCVDAPCTYGALPPGAVSDTAN